MHCIKIWIMYNVGKFVKFIINNCCLIQHVSLWATSPMVLKTLFCFVLFCQQKEEDSQSKDERKYVENRDKNMGNQVR